MADRKVSKKEFEELMKKQEGTVTREHKAGTAAQDVYLLGEGAGATTLGRVELSGDGKDDQYFIEG